MLKHPFFTVLMFALAAVAVLHIPGLYFFWYWKMAWLDLVTHFGGGFWVGGTLLFLLYSFLGGRLGSSRILFFRTAGLAVIGTLLVGAGWEIFEVCVDALSMTEPGYWSDTAIDIVADLTGATTACYYFFIRRYYETFSPAHEKE